MKKVEIELDVPGWVNEAMLAEAIDLLRKNLFTLKSEGELRKYLHGAQMDGYGVVPSAVPKEKLMETCIRAFWWKFGDICAAKDTAARAMALH